MEMILQNFINLGGFIMKGITSEVSNIISKIGIIFSWPLIASINIGISGYLWGVILSLDKEGEDYFKIPIPPIFRFKISGQQVIAGFAAFSVSLLIVGAFCHKIASLIFIDNLQITKDKNTACNLLATSISLILCILILCLKMVVNYYSIKRNFYRESEQSIVQLLVAAKKEEDENDSKRDF